MQESNIHKLVSLTFDENPKVRKEAAKSLADIDDPAALFALMELSYDKDPSVKRIAKELMNKRKSKDEEVMSFAEIFSHRTTAQLSPEVQDTPEEKKKRILYPIEQLFEKKLGKQRADVVKGKMMPTIEKIYTKVSMGSATKADHAETGRVAMQEFLTSYLDAMKDIDSLSDPKHEETSETDAEEAAAQTLMEEKEVHEHPHVLQETLDIVGGKKVDAHEAADEIATLDQEEMEETTDSVSKLPSTFIKKIYETMMLSEGDDEIMKREMKRIMKDVEHDVKFAFDAARKRFKETNVTHLTKLKEGMGMINTDVLEVKSVDHLSWKKGKDDLKYCRLLVKDAEGNEGVVYITDKNSEWLKPGMTIKVLKGRVKSFEFSGETGISVGKKGSIYIVL
jgi:hypothetical protein